MIQNKNTGNILRMFGGYDYYLLNYSNRKWYWPFKKI